MPPVVGAGEHERVELELGEDPLERRRPPLALRRGGAGAHRTPPGGLERLEREHPPGLDVRPDRLLDTPAIGRLEALDEGAVLGPDVAGIVPVAEDPLHEEIHRQPPVEVGEEAVPGQIDLQLVEALVRGDEAARVDEAAAANARLRLVHQPA